MTDRYTTAPRELATAELHQANGGAAYMKLGDIRGDVSAAAEIGGTLIPVKVKHNL